MNKLTRTNDSIREYWKKKVLILLIRQTILGKDNREINIFLGEKRLKYNIMMIKGELKDLEWRAVNGSWGSRTLGEDYPKRRYLANAIDRLYQVYKYKGKWRAMYFEPEEYGSDNIIHIADVSSLSMAQLECQIHFRNTILELLNPIEEDDDFLNKK